MSKLQQIRELLEADPTLPDRTIAERVGCHVSLVNRQRHHGTDGTGTPGFAPGPLQIGSRVAFTVLSEDDLAHIAIIEKVYPSRSEMMREALRFLAEHL